MTEVNLQFDDEPYSKRVGRRIAAYSILCSVFFAISSVVVTSGHPSLFFASPLCIIFLFACLIIIIVQANRERYFLLSVVSDKTGFTVEYYDAAQKTKKMLPGGN